MPQRLKEKNIKYGLGGGTKGDTGKTGSGPGKGGSSSTVITVEGSSPITIADAYGFGTTNKNNTNKNKKDRQTKRNQKKSKKGNKKRRKRKK